MPLTVETILLQCNHSELTLRCLDSLRRQDRPVRVTVVDNGSLPEHLDAVKGKADKLIASPRNLKFCGGMNHGWRESKADIVCLLCNDTVLASTCTRRAVAAFEADASLGWVCATYQQGNWWTTCVREFPEDAMAELPEGHEALDRWARTLGDLPDLGYQTKTEVTCVFIRRAVSDAIGYFDEKLTNGHHDVDYGIRMAQAGWRAAVCRNAVFHHMLGSPTVAAEKAAKRLDLPTLEDMNAYMLGKWGKRLAHWWTVDGTIAPPMILARDADLGPITKGAKA